jgi:hypothetical protein
MVGENWGLPFSLRSGMIVNIDVCVCVCRNVQTGCTPALQVRVRATCVHKAFTACPSHQPTHRSTHRPVHLATTALQVMCHFLMLYIQAPVLPLLWVTPNSVIISFIDYWSETNRISCVPVVVSVCRVSVMDNCSWLGENIVQEAWILNLL